MVSDNLFLCGWGYFRRHLAIFFLLGTEQKSTAIVSSFEETCILDPAPRHRQSRRPGALIQITQVSQTRPKRHILHCMDNLMPHTFGNAL
jgi:hypothetical protein